MDYCPKCIKIWEKKYNICPFCGYESEYYPFEGSVFDILDDMAALKNDRCSMDIYSDDFYKNNGEDKHICQNDVIESIRKTEKLRDKNKTDVCPPPKGNRHTANQRETAKKVKGRRAQSSRRKGNLQERADTSLNRVKNKQIVIEKYEPAANGKNLPNTVQTAKKSDCTQNMPNISATSDIPNMSNRTSGNAGNNSDVLRTIVFIIFMIVFFAPAVLSAVFRLFFAFLP